MRKYIRQKNYEGYDRRNGEMRLKDIVTPTTIITLVVALIALGGYKFTVQATEGQVKVNTEKISTIRDKVGKLETEIPNIKESINRIETSQMETQKDIKLLLRRSD